MERIIEYNVIDDYVGKYLLVLLTSYYKMSSSLIADLKKYDNGICVNGKHENVRYILKKGDVVTITIKEMSVNEIVPTDMDINILYEDEDVMAVDKPANMPTHPSMGNYENTLANGITAYWQKRGEDRVFRAANRLDKNTSGIVLIAKNAYAHARLCEFLHTDDFQRKYIAVVEGRIEKDGTIDAPIAREGDSIIKRCVRADGQRAVTHYKVLEVFNRFTLIEFCLETGRTHQIRVHISYIGHPLVCDFLYGSENCEVIKRQALHSSYLKFKHPLNGNIIEVSSPVPYDMQELICYARNH